MTTWSAACREYAEAAAWFTATTTKVGDRWDEPGLGAWDVRALVGHTTRALLTVEAYLARPADAVVVASAVEYYRATSAISGGADVEQRGRDAGAALGEDPVTAVRAIVDRVLPLLAATDGTEVVTTVAGGMRLADYLPTRAFELVVHTLDLTAALDLPDAPPAAPAAAALRLAVDLAATGDQAGPVLLALTGRRALPAGFSVL